MKIDIVRGGIIERSIGNAILWAIRLHIAAVDDVKRAKARKVMRMMREMEE